MSLFTSIAELAGGAYGLSRSAQSITRQAARTGFSKIENGKAGRCPAIEEMFTVNGMSYEQMQQAMLDAYDNLENTQHGDVFHFEIVRQAPTYPTEKSLIISSMVTEVEITSAGINAEEVIVGSAFYNELKDAQSGEVQVTFLESKQGDVRDFLKKRVTTDLQSIGSGVSKLQDNIAMAQRVGNVFGMNTSPLKNIGGVLGSFSNKAGRSAKFGDDIMPIDGTYLLPYDYYFSIKLSHLIRVGSETVEKIMLSDDFILDGGTNTGYTTGDERYLTTSATFKPLQGWEN